MNILPSSQLASVALALAVSAGQTTLPAMTQSAGQVIYKCMPHEGGKKEQFYLRVRYGTHGGDMFITHSYAARTEHLTGYMEKDEDSFRLEVSGGDIYSVDRESGEFEIAKNGLITTGQCTKP